MPTTTACRPLVALWYPFGVGLYGKFVVVVFLNVLVFDGCTCSKSPERTVATVNNGSDGKLGTLRVGERSVVFYIAYAPDAAVLGFAVEDKAGTKQYFPVYGSTYRGLPAGRFDVYLSQDETQMWLRSNWLGNETLAYHKLGTSTCLTGYGEVQAMKKKMPDHLSGGAVRVPTIDMARAKRVLTMTHADGPSPAKASW